MWAILPPRRLRRKLPLHCSCCYSQRGKPVPAFSPPRKPRNHDVRPREYLTETEVESLIDAAASQGRHGHRDATMILLAFRHGLRVSELIGPCTCTLRCAVKHNGE